MAARHTRELTRETRVVGIPHALLSARQAANVARVLHEMIANPVEVRRLSGGDLFTIALLFTDEPGLSFAGALDVLLENGIRWARGEADLAKRLADGVREAAEAFRVLDAAERLTLADERAAEARLLRLGFRLVAPRKRPRDSQPRRPPPAPARPAPPTTRPIATRPAATASAPPRPPPPPAIPPPAPFAHAAPRLLLPELGALFQILGAAPATQLRASVALRGHLIAAAGSFTELLSPASMIGVEAHRYQHETVERVLRVLRGRALLADEVGLGKTIEAMMALREYQLRGMARRTLIIVPAPLVAQWAGELEAKASIAARTTDDALFDADPASFFEGDGVVIASLSKARGARAAPAITAKPWDLVIVDEAHHVKNRTTASWKIVNAIETRFLLLLTATPIETDLEEIYNLVTLLRPGQFQTPAAFKAQFVDKSDPTSPKNRERLRALLGEVMIRNTRAACGLKLPPRFVTTSLVDPAPEERALYEAVVGLVRADAESGRRATLGSILLLEAGSSPDAVNATLMKAEQRDGLAALSDAARTAAAAGTRKLEHLATLLAAHQGHGLVFTRFRETAAAIVRSLERAKLRTAQFIGGMSGAEKQDALARFRDERCVLVATDVGGEGQNLQHCNVVINFDVPWNPMLLEQRIGRLHRMGQEREVHVYNLASRGTAEERLLDVLDRRVHLFELVVGEMDMVLGNLTDDRDLEDRVLALYAHSKNDSEVEQGFDAIAHELLRARGRYEDTRKLDSAVFGEDFNA